MKREAWQTAILDNWFTSNSKNGHTTVTKKNTYILGATVQSELASLVTKRIPCP